MTCILIIEDCPDVCEIVQSLLVQGGLEAEIAEDMETTLKDIAALKYACILMDLNLSEMRGFSRSTWRERLDSLACASNHQIPIVTMSGEDRCQECLKAGSIRFLEKPFSGPELMSAIKTAINVPRPS